MFVKSSRIFIRITALITISTLMLPMSTSVAAQDETQQQLLACDRLGNAQDRLECFNAVVGGIKEESDPSNESAEAPVATVPPAPTPVETVLEVPAATAVEDEASRPAAAPAPTVNEAAEAPPVAPTSGRSDFGLEDQKASAARQAERERKREGQDQVVYSTIVEVRRVRGERFEARLENGQVWRETEATRTVRRPKVGDSVRITSGRLGSYRMKFNNDNRLASVRRIE